MLLVKTRLGPSRKHGIGLFADEMIPKGTVTWEYTPWFDKSYTKEDLEKMSETARNQIIWYAYFDPKIDMFILPSDDQRFINHSSSKAEINIDSLPEKDTARKDIAPGEELLCDYHGFDPEYFKRHGKEVSDLK